jgi:hypothetical protein
MCLEFMQLAAFIVAIAFAVQTPAQNLGSFTLAGQTFTVVVRNPSQLEIRDQSSAVQYRKAMPSGVSVMAKLAAGNDLAGLLMHYTNEDAESWQLFRLRDGKLALLDPPMNAAPVTANAIVAGGRGSLLATRETIDLRIWGGNFYLFVPLRVDWKLGRTAPGQQCFEMAGTPGLAEVGCEMRVEAVPKPRTADFTFVRLFNEATENMGSARHVVIKKDANIEYLAAKAIVKWSTSGDEFSANLSDIWLKVLIDNNEDNLGWIHADEDFAAVGLPRQKAER